MLPRGPLTCTIDVVAPATWEMWNQGQTPTKERMLGFIHFNSRSTSRAPPVGQAPLWASRGKDVKGADSTDVHTPGPYRLAEIAEKHDSPMVSPLWEMRVKWLRGDQASRKRRPSNSISKGGPDAGDEAEKVF